MRLRIGQFPDEVWVAPAFSAAPFEGAKAISPHAAAFALTGWLGSPHDRHMLAELCTLLCLPLVIGPRAFSSSIFARIREAFARGELVAYRAQLKLSGSAVAPSIEPMKPEPDHPKEEKTFVLIELIDDADPPQPVAYEKYRIELPDYSVREGLLDQNGRAEVSGIDPGECKVTFPNLLREDWWFSSSAGG
ncbi:MAG: hypothetical protein ABJE95_11765 [Byssovorax sp.]